MADNQNSSLTSFHSKEPSANSGLGVSKSSASHLGMDRSRVKSSQQKLSGPNMSILDHSAASNISPAASRRKLKISRSGNTQAVPEAPSYVGKSGGMEAVEVREKGPLDYAKIVQLMVASNTQMLFERQLSVLRRVHRRNREGYAYGDLNYIAEILKLTAQRVEAGAHPDFEPVLCDLVEACGKPLCRAKANEELMAHGQANFRALVAALGELLGCDFRHIQLEAAIALRQLANGNPGPGEENRDMEVYRVPGGQTVARDLRRPRRDVNQEALCHEDVPRKAVEQLKIQVEILREMTLSRPPSGRPTIDPENEENPAEDNEESSDDEDLVGDMLGEINEDDGVSVDELVRGLIGLVHELSTDSTNSTALCEAGGLRPILRLIDGRELPYVKPLAQMGAATLDVLIELLWNCLEHSYDRVNSVAVYSRTEMIKIHRKANAMYLLAQDEFIGILKELLEEMLKRGYRHKDKELRNEVLIVISLVAKHPNSHQCFHSTAMLHLLIKYATVSEGGLDSFDDDDDLPNSANFATTLEVDIELKRLMWSLLVELCASDRDNLAAVVGSPLMETLLMYLDMDREPSQMTNTNTSLYMSSKSQNWSSMNNSGLVDIKEKLVETDSQLTVNTNAKKFSKMQLHILQQQALSVLLNLAPRAPGRFRALGGHVITLRLLDPSVSGTSDLAQSAMMLLLSVVGLPDIQEELVRLDAMRIMLARFMDHSALPSLRADAVCILSRLCKNSKENQVEFRHLGGVESLISALKEYCAQRSRTVADRKKKNAVGSDTSSTDKLDTLIIHAVDCLWNATVNNKKSESRFLSADGMDAVLDLLEVCPTSMRHQVTGLLADVARNKRVLPYLKAWRSDVDMSSAVQLLLRFWEEEEKQLGLARPGGILQNCYRPLSSHIADGGDNLARPPGSDLAMISTQRTGGGSIFEQAAGGMLDSSLSSQSSGAFSRLNDALKASVTLGSGLPIRGSMASQKGGLTNNDRQQLAKAVSVLDLRAKIALVLKQLAFSDKDHGLTPHQKMALLMARHYEDFRESGAWMDVYEELKKEKVNPIAADRLLLDSKLECAFNQTLNVKCQQMEFKTQKHHVEKESEDQFLAGILLQRDQEIHQEIIKRNALIPKSTLQKRKAEKEAKAKMLAASRVKESPMLVDLPHEELEQDSLEDNVELTLSPMQGAEQHFENSLANDSNIAPQNAVLIDDDDFGAF
mmetsp:Transcript_8913/g.11809  ORF Transcript_8913/g.11809 Transcript_8913/m.11809 type:complete len:1206 (+) Transcript_8913:188-3805(+)